MRQCIGCGRWRGEAAFYFVDRPARYGRAARREISSRCRDCTKKKARGWYGENRERAIEQQTEYASTRKREKAAYDHGYRLREYGITVDEYDAMLDAQAHACASCRTPFDRGGPKTRRPHVDHCHASGKVRALLCHACNVSLGQMQDNPERVRALLAYLESHLG